MKLNKEGLPEFEGSDHEEALQIAIESYHKGFTRVLHTWIKENGKVVYGPINKWWKDGRYYEDHATHKAYLLPPIPIKECKHKNIRPFDVVKYFVECTDCGCKLKATKWEVVE